MTERKYIERSLQRRSGMSAEKLEAMHKFNDAQEWTARCWKCHALNTGLMPTLITCTSCGANLRSRDE